MVGLVRISGNIDIDQFWPAGDSDADTAKVEVAVDGIAFAPDGVNFRPTTALVGAFVRGTGTRPVIDNRNRVKVRLQGIDAPELHFKAPPLDRREFPDLPEDKRDAYKKANKKERRQYWAETATHALGEKFGTFAQDTVPCIVVSFVDTPSELVDTYGRVVGDIRIGDNFNLDINTWLIEEGWAYPSFYSSMRPDEIEVFLAAMKTGKEKKRLWDHYDRDIRRFDPNMFYRGRGAGLDPAADVGPVLMPKLFRRQVSFEVQKAAGLVTGDFWAFLANQRRPDECYKTDEFLAEGLHAAPTYKLFQFIEADRCTVEPHELVFKEKFSIVVDAAGKEIESF